MAIQIPGDHGFNSRYIKKILHEVKTLNLPLYSAFFPPLTVPPIVAACSFLRGILEHPISCRGCLTTNSLLRGAESSGPHSSKSLDT